MRHLVTLALLGTLVLLIVCQGKKKSDVQVQRSSSFDQELTLGGLTGTPVNIAGIKFAPPENWKDLGPSGMRAASYYYGPSGKDKDSATVAVFYFGAQGAGGIEQNMARWIGQMSSQSGVSGGDQQVYDTVSVGDITVYTVEVTGTYTPSAMGQPAGTDVSPREGYLLAAAIVQAPEGNLFFRLTGPLQTADEMTQGLVRLVFGITKAAS